MRKPVVNDSTQLTDNSRRQPRVGGVTPFTATDYPGKLAAVIFLQGCPWRCGYCHNQHLQQRTSEAGLQWPEVMSLLARRTGLIDAVVFSGGEPTTDPALGAAILQAKALGFEIGLHTAGTYVKRLEAVLPMIDWVGVDVKAPFGLYQRITGVEGSGQHALASANLVIASGVDHEFRTTIHPSLLQEDEIYEMAVNLAGMGVKSYALQVFRPTGCNNPVLNAVSTAGYPSETLLRKVEPLFPKFTLRRI
jgi:pyruvate formate lyase activating enzyme